jgi:hypothetical protein
MSCNEIHCFILCLSHASQAKSKFVLSLPHLKLIFFSEDPDAATWETTGSDLYLVADGNPSEISS